MRNPVLATVGMSVRLSVCPYVRHTLAQSKRRKLGSRNLHHGYSHSNLGDKKFVKKFERGHPERGR